MRLTLWQRLSLAFALLLLACWGVSAWLQVRASEAHEQETVQRLSRELAAHIAKNTALMGRDGFDRDAVHELFGMLMVVNPSVEVYLLDIDGRIEALLAPPRHLKRNQVELAPLRRFLAGEALPIVGDDPRSDGGRKVFSAAPLRVDGRDAGYVYVVLLGEAHDALAADVMASSVLRTTLGSMALIATLMLLAGLIAFALITRRLRALTGVVRELERNGFDAAALSQQPAARAGERDEIALLQQAFAQMAGRIAAQWRELVDHDRQRREMVANISHDLRTPLTSLHGYLETLSLKSGLLSDAERRRYLETALAQSRKVGRLAQELFELARLEHGAIKPEHERFSLAELTQDVFQKFELASEARRLKLAADFAPDLPAVSADLGMIERVLTNLLDNAVRNTPEGGEVSVELRHAEGRVTVQVADTGPGIPAELRSGLFTRPSAMTAPGRARGGGLGLVIVQRILQLHGSDIELIDRPGRGAVFSFGLACEGARGR